jgi:hypothetical protein
LIYLATELEPEGVDDKVHLAKAAELGAVLVSQNQSDFDPLHKQWQEEGRTHAGILVTFQAGIGTSFARLERAARLLTPEIAHNQLMKLSMFATEEQGRVFVLGLNP